MVGIAGDDFIVIHNAGDLRDDKANGITGSKADDFMVVSFGKDGEMEDWTYDRSAPTAGLYTAPASVPSPAPLPQQKVFSRIVFSGIS